MYKKENFDMVSGVKRTFLSLSACLFILLILFVPLSYSGDFKLIKVNSHYEPQLGIEPAIAIPNTDIKAGAYEYVADNGNEVYMLGFLIDKQQFYYVESEEYNLSGDINYGVYQNYFVIDSWGYGAGRNRLLFLCKYQKNTIQLLDVIGAAYVEPYKMDFISVSDRKAGCISNCPFGQIIIKDVDYDGNPEIKLKIFEIYNFELYFQIVNERLQVNFNPALYKPLFEIEKKKSQLKTKSVNYNIYGFLAKEVGLKEIKDNLKNDKNKYKEVITLLENIDKWDSAFHEHGNEKFVLKQYNLKRR